MIFAHAPIIFPAVLGARMTYRSLFNAHVVLLQVTLVVRLIGDAAGWSAGRQVGGLLNAEGVSAPERYRTTQRHYWAPAPRDQSPGGV